MLKHGILVLLCPAMIILPALSEPVCKVVDGDTFHFCNGLKVRLSGVDAPEHGEPFYLESRRTLAELLQGGKGLKLQDCHTDTTGKRKACGVLVDGQDIQAELVRQGMAWDWPKYSKGKYKQYEEDAKASKTGLWVDTSATTQHWSMRKLF